MLRVDVMTSLREDVKRTGTAPVDKFAPNLWKGARGLTTDMTLVTFLYKIKY